MAQLEFSRGEVDELTRKLDSLESHFSDRERVLLLAIFAAAGNRVRPLQGDEAPYAEQTIENLREQLANAFIPESGQEFVLEFVRIGPDSRPA